MSELANLVRLRLSPEDMDIHIWWCTPLIPHWRRQRLKAHLVYIASPRPAWATRNLITNL